MSKKILLINPWIYDFAAYDFWVKPLGLLSLASLLRENGHDIYYIDCLEPFHPRMLRDPQVKAPKRKPTGAGKFAREIIPSPLQLKHVPKNYNRYGITPEIFKDELAGIPRPDLIFVTSMMTYWYPGVIDTIRLVKEAYPGVPLVLGGNYVSLCRDHAAAHSGADCVVTGEGERALSRILERFCGDLPRFLPDFSDLDTYPYPAFDLLKQADQVPIITSRGCPFRCTYCASHLLNDRFRTRSPLKVVDEIESWNKLRGVRNFAFYDDALLVGANSRAIPMLRELMRRDIDCEFHCPNGLHLREITKELATLMYRARFTTIRFGFETASVKRQLDTGGKITNDEARDAIAHLRNAGYGEDDIGMYILCGLPGQTSEEVEATIEFIKSCGARPVIAEYSPIPGTDLWGDAVARSRYDLTGEPLFHNNTLLPCQNSMLTYEMYERLKSLTRER
ncbi:MAG: B12-binding domain-containing radical SAM protein [Deltaproteobacteria bacterium]|nr:B12-binding domain-containing radical SAM protein [Deltaproteobacteria bacterium]MBN2687612.1 B12-binding domain-containing radical SAM protein [Deltaproteobacteria bacterium]